MSKNSAPRKIWFLLALLLTGCRGEEKPGGPPPAQVHYEAGRKAVGEKQTRAARNELETAIRLDPAFAEPYFALAALDEAEGNPLQGADRLGALRRANPHAKGVEARQAELYLAADYFFKPLEKSREAVQREPDSPKGHILLGILQDLAGEPDKALLSLQTAHRIAPDSERVTLTLAQKLAAAGRTDDALALTEPLLKEPRLPVQVYYVQGSLLAEYGRNGKKDIPAGLQMLDKALALDPNHAPANALKGRLLVARGKLAAAKPFLETARKNGPGEAATQRALAAVYAREKPDEVAKLRRSAALLETFLNDLRTARCRYLADPDDVPNVLRLAKLEARRGNIKEAREAVHAVLQKDPNRTDALTLMNELLSPRPPDTNPKKGD